MNIQKDIKKLNKKLNKLRKEREAARKTLEYHKVEETKALHKNSHKQFQKHKFRALHYTEKLAGIKAEIETVKGKVSDLELQLEKQRYLKKLKAFDDMMVSKLEALASGLDIFVKEQFLCDLNALYHDTYNYYTVNSPGLDREDLKPYASLGLREHVAIAITNIMEKVNDAQVYRATRGENLYRGIIAKPITWAKNLSNQLKDLVKVVKQRSSLETLEEKINNGK